MLHFPRWKIICITLICLLSVLFAIPSLLPEHTRQTLPEWLPQRTVSLGLDLQGGSQLLLQIDINAYDREQLTNLTDELRNALRKQRIGYKGLTVRGEKVHMTLRDASDEQLRDVLKGISPDLEMEQGAASEYVIRFNEKWHTESRQQLLEQSIQIIDRRVNETGTKEPIIQRQGDDRILLQVPGLADPERLKRLLGKTAKMTFHLVNETVTDQDITRGIMPAGTRLVSSADKEDSMAGVKYAVYSRVMLSGDMLTNASLSYDENGQPAVSFRFNTTGARKFGEITAENVGTRFAILLDNKVITAPVIRSPILGGSGIITGQFTAQSANDLAILLRAGALPVPLNILEERSVGPSLGADSIAAGSKAFIIGIVMVVVFMVVFYGLFGLFANIAMLINAFMIVSLLALFEATLTMPGIAGIVLTVGMAVDANVLVYERIREEMRNGKTPYAAVQDGFRMAIGTILDSQITTFVAALILFYFGTGSVKGFAVTLAIGITCSLFTAILVTRMMVVLWLKKVRPKTLKI
ncbi:MAG: protein translocase subunit SecD [Alphaproteobacteria bacterium]